MNRIARFSEEYPNLSSLFVDTSTGHNQPLDPEIAKQICGELLVLLESDDSLLAFAASDLSPKADD